MKRFPQNPPRDCVCMGPCTHHQDRHQSAGISLGVVTLRFTPRQWQFIGSCQPCSTFNPDSHQLCSTLHVHLPKSSSIPPPAPVYTHCSRPESRQLPPTPFATQPSSLLGSLCSGVPIGPSGHLPDIDETLGPPLLSAPLTKPPSLHKLSHCRSPTFDDFHTSLPRPRCLPKRLHHFLHLFFSPNGPVKTVSAL